MEKEGKPCAKWSKMLVPVAVVVVILMVVLDYVVLYSQATPLLVLATVARSSITDFTSVSHQCHPFSLELTASARLIPCYSFIYKYVRPLWVH